MTDNCIISQLNCIAKLEFSAKAIIKIVSSTKNAVMVSFLIDDTSEFMIFEITDAGMLVLFCKTNEVSVAYDRFIEAIATIKKKHTICKNKQRKN